MVLESAADDHDRVVEGPLDLVDELLSTAAEEERARLGLRAARKDVEALRTDLALLKECARAEVLRLEVIDRRLDRSANRLDCPNEILVRNATRTKDAAVRKELRRQIANRQLEKHREPKQLFPLDRPWTGRPEHRQRQSFRACRR